MKNNKQTDDFVSEMDALIKNRHAQFKQEAELHATQTAILNKPEQDEPSINSFIGRIISNYQTLLAELHSQFDSHTSIVLGGMEREEVAKRVIDVLQQVATLYSENQTRKNLYADKPILLPIIGFIIGMLGSYYMVSGEWTYLADSFQTIASSRYKAEILAGGMSISLLALSHLAPAYLKEKIESPNIRRALILFIFLIVLGVLILLGKMRSDYLKRLNDADSSMWMFALITGLLFAGLYLMSAMVLVPLFPFVKDAFTALFKRIKIVKTDAKINKKNKHVKEIETKLSEGLKERVVLIAKDKNNQKRVDALYEETVSYAKNTNLSKRTDGVVPKCFSDPIPPLTHFTDDINL